MLDAKTVEKVVSLPTLMVRSELDVLRTIIHWLEARAKEYNCMEDVRTFFGEKLVQYLGTDQAGLDGCIL